MIIRRGWQLGLRALGRPHTAQYRPLSQFIIGLESTFDDSALGAVNDKHEILADIRHTQDHSKYGSASFKNI